MRLDRKIFGVATALLLAAAANTASAQNVADYNLNPLSRAYASDSGAYGSRPSGAINGNTNPYYDYAGNFHHSGGVSLVGPSPATPWWYVDLGGYYDISKLVFHFRADCCSSQNDGDFLQIWASTPDFSNTGNALWSALIDDNLSGTYILTTPLTARYVAVDGRGGNIVFPELEVHGVASQVVATPEPASLVLLGTGLLGIAGVVRRRRK